MISNITWNGIESFTGEFDAVSIESLKELAVQVDETILVAIPYLEYSNEELLKIEAFVDGGGTLLLMDDYGYGNSVLAHFDLDIRFTNRPLLDALFCYKNQWLPRVTDFTPDVKENGIEVLLLNHATTLTNVGQMETIARSSRASFLDINENESWDENEPQGPFPVASVHHFGKGTLVLISDPSIVINSMVDRDDNYDFIKYLMSYDGAKTAILIDNSHLTKTPLDVSKTWLIGARRTLSTPYPLLGIVALIFVAVSRYTLKKGEISG